MGILNIQPATRNGAHLLINLPGGPSSGKTRTGLLLARGIAGPNGKVGCLDTESGRARLHADKIPGGFFVGELTPPFTPERYRKSIEEFLEARTDVLVIDSFSHVWEGVGGVLEQADLNEKSGKRGQQIWLKPKVEYRKLIAFIMSTSMHLILCSRAKQPLIEVIENGKKNLVPGPWEPIQDKRFLYETTIALRMLQHGSYETQRDPERLRCPEDLLPLFDGSPVGIETGKKIAEWVGGTKTVDHDAELLLKRAGDIARDGMEAYRRFFEASSKDEKKILKAHEDNLKSIAKAADEAREDDDRQDDDQEGDRGDQGGGQQDSPPADPFANRQQPEKPPADQAPPPAELKHLPALPTNGDWTDWLRAAKAKVEATDKATLRELDDEFRKLAGLPDVVHGEVSRAIKARGKALKG